MINKKWLEKKETCKQCADWFVEKYGDEGSKQGLEVIKDLIADNKPDWANWLIVRIMERKQYLAYAIFAAEQVIDIFEKQYPNDNRPRLAIEAAKKVLDNDTEENRATAWAADAAGAAADAAAWAADAARAARSAAWAAARAAWAAAWAARSAAWSAAWAADAAADAAARSADAAADAAARSAAWAAARAETQIRILDYGIGLFEEDQ